MKFYAQEVLPPFETRPEILLHPQIPKPLHTLTPRTLKGKKWWDEKRHEAYKKYNYRCWACGIHGVKLEGHEMYDIDFEKGCSTFVEVVALCHRCHMYIHGGMLTVLYEQGKVSREVFRAIIDHGNALLMDAMKMGKITKKQLQKYQKGAEFPENVKWSDWHLIIEGEKFGSKFKSEAEWRIHFERL